MFDQIDAPSLNVKRSFLCCIHFSKSLLKTMHSNGGTNANVLPIIEFEQHYKSPFENKWKYSLGRHAHTTPQLKRLWQQAPKCTSSFSQAITMLFIRISISLDHSYCCQAASYRANEKCSRQLCLMTQYSCPVSWWIQTRIWNFLQ